MFVRRKILVSLSKEELEQRIGKCCIQPFHHAKISGNHFCAYILLRQRLVKLIRIPRCLHGMYQISENGYLVQYAAQASVSSFILLAVTACSVLYGLFSLFCGQKSQWFVLVGVMFGFVTILDILWQEQEGADRFEKRLKNGEETPPLSK